jgi:hypothetical protein
MDFDMGMVSLGEPWHWLVLGAVLMGLEILAAGIFLVWFGLAALLTGLVGLVVPMEFAAQILVFGVLSLVVIFPIRRLARMVLPEDEKEVANLNRLGANMVGRKATITEAVVNGSGAVHFGDTRWVVRADTDLPVGADVVIVRLEGATLFVEPKDT